MKISVLSSVCEQVPKGSFVWIALDVIRATSSMVTFLAEGGRSILVTDSIELALGEKAKDPSVVLVGERGGMKIEGFDFDNSPGTLARHADRNILNQLLFICKILFYILNFLYNFLIFFRN